MNKIINSLVNILASTISINTDNSNILFSRISDDIATILEVANDGLILDRTNSKMYHVVARDLKDNPFKAIIVDLESEEGNISNLIERVYLSGEAHYLFIANNINADKDIEGTCKSMSFIAGRIISVFKEPELAVSTMEHSAYDVYMKAIRYAIPLLVFRELNKINYVFGLSDFEFMYNNKNRGLLKNHELIKKAISYFLFEERTDGLDLLHLQNLNS